MTFSKQYFPSHLLKQKEVSKNKAVKYLSEQIYCTTYICWSRFFLLLSYNLTQGLNSQVYYIIYFFSFFLTTYTWNKTGVSQIQGHGLREWVWTFSVLAKADLKYYLAAGIPVSWLKINPILPCSSILIQNWFFTQHLLPWASGVAI